MRFGVFPALLLLVAGCATVNPYYDPAKPHHTAQGFRNNYIGKVDKSFGELIRWQIERRTQGLPRAVEDPARPAFP